LEKVKKVVKQRHLIKALAFFIWCTGPVSPIFSLVVVVEVVQV